LTNHQQQRKLPEDLALSLEGRFRGNQLDPHRYLRVMREEDARSRVFVLMRLKVHKIGKAGCPKTFLSPWMRRVDKDYDRWLMELPECHDGRGNPNVCSMRQAAHLHSF
jgi:hypothetical protein